MFKHILLPTDGSKLSGKAAKQAIQLAKSVGAKLTVINITPRFAVSAIEEGGGMPVPAIIKRRFDEEAAGVSKKLIDKVKADAGAAGVACNGVIVSSHNPYDAIIKHARKAGCDLILMASHGRKGLSALLLGSETTKVLTHSAIPVLVVR